MKNKFLAVIVCIFALRAVSAVAQTQTQTVTQVPNLMPPATVTPATTTPAPATADTLQQLEQVAKDGYTSLKSQSFKDGFDLAPFVLYHKGDYGAGVAFSTLGNSAGLSYGFAVAAVQETAIDTTTGLKHKSFNFYDGSVSINYNGTVDLPVLGNCTYYAEEGPATDLKNIGAGVYSQTSAGIRKTWDVNGNVHISAWGGPMYLTKWGDVAYIGGISITSQLKGKHLWGLW